MSTYIHTLTALETACGVTLEQVAEILPKVLVMKDGAVMLPHGIGPALASSVARCALGSPALYVGCNTPGYPIYRKA
ncbi:hypothetical protein [Frigoribacterium sp. UYMn621]|uniref:hypothetical protein n=1 Tax=Frigoribacterium sp. UYMn621 TaxID=3156343 RepID=UPI00339AF6E8